MAPNPQLLNEVAALYDWLNRQTRRYDKPDKLCSACGNCCSFKEFEHLLFVTGPELIFLAANLNEKLKKMSDSTCPYNLSAIAACPPKPLPDVVPARRSLDEGGLTKADWRRRIATADEAGKCTIYDYRFSGCRIFSCKADKDFQAVLSESAVKKLKSICAKFEIPYTYCDLKTALENFGS